MTEQTVEQKIETNDKPNVELQPKRRVGNPNWTKGYKKPVAPEPVQTFSETLVQGLPKEVVWVKMFTAITMNANCNCSQIALAIAADQADFALTLYNTRFG